MRARWIKPEFFLDRKVADLCSTMPYAGYVFEALWCWADDGGTAQADPEIIKGQAFARWNSITVPEISGILQALADTGQITLYAAGDDQYAIIRNWKKHQAVHKPRKFRYPSPPQGFVRSPSTEVPENSGNVPENLGNVHLLDTKTPRHLDSETPRREEPPAVSPSLDSTEPLDPPPLPHLPASVDPMPFLGAFYSRDCSPQRQDQIVRQLREALSPRGCRIAHGVTVRTTPEVMQRGLDDLVKRKASIKKPDAAVVVLLKMLKEGRVNLEVNEHGETATEAAAAREKASAAEDEAIHRARRERAAAWAKRNPEAVQHITHRVDLRYGGKPADGFKRAVYEQEILAACLKASENGTAAHPARHGAPSPSEGAA